MNTEHKEFYCSTLQDYPVRIPPENKNLHHWYFIECTKECTENDSTELFYIISLVFFF